LDFVSFGWFWLKSLKLMDGHTTTDSSLPKHGAFLFAHCAYVTSEKEQICYSNNAQMREAFGLC
jgi:hypothetical protein